MKNKRISRQMKQAAFNDLKLRKIKKKLVNFEV
jgi:hypothetical protein